MFRLLVGTKGGFKGRRKKASQGVARQLEPWIYRLERMGRMPEITL